jgi:hypothetical protein
VPRRREAGRQPRQSIHGPGRLVWTVAASRGQTLHRGQRGKRRPARWPLFVESDVLFSLSHFHQEIVPMASKSPSNARA